MRLWRLWRKPTRDVRATCGTWRRGDLAVCIGDRWLDFCPQSPRAGDILRVTSVDEGVAHGILARGLRFEGKPSNCCWDARGFRKAVQDDQPAAVDFRLLTCTPEPVAS